MRQTGGRWRALARTPELRCSRDPIGRVAKKIGRAEGAVQELPADMPLQCGRGPEVRA